MTRTRPGIVVIGIGNVVRSDDGLGVHVVRQLRGRDTYGEAVTLIEGGTLGLMLLPHLAEASHAIIIDAVAAGHSPGTLVRLDRAEGLFATGMTPHDVGLSDLLDAMRLTDATPDHLVLHGAQPESTAFGTDLTPALAHALDALADVIEAELLTWVAPSPPRPLRVPRDVPAATRRSG